MIKKQNKTCKKAKSKNQYIARKKLAISNSREAKLDIFNDILSNLVTAPLKYDKTSISSSN